MKNAFKAMVAMVSLSLVTAAWAATEVVDGVTWYYETYSSGGSTYARVIAGADKYTGDLTVPTTLGGCAVKEIGGFAFYGCTALKSVVIQEGVKSIGDYAFFDCDCLASVTLQEGLESIGEWAFRDCDALETIEIPASVKSIDGGGVLWLW